MEKKQAREAQEEEMVEMEEKRPQDARDTSRCGELVLDIHVEGNDDDGEEQCSPRSQHLLPPQPQLQLQQQHQPRWLNNIHDSNDSPSSKKKKFLVPTWLHCVCVVLVVGCVLSWVFDPVEVMREGLVGIGFDVGMGEKVGGSGSGNGNGEGKSVGFDGWVGWEGLEYHFIL